LKKDKGLSAEEIRIRDELLKGSKLQECFIGYYYDGIHIEKEAIKIDRNAILIIPSNK